MSEDEKSTDVAALSPMELADVMLLEILARGHGSILLEPSDSDNYLLRYEGDGETEVLASQIPAPLSEAVQIRLAVIAGQTFAPPLLAKLPVRAASHMGTPDLGTTPVMLAVRPGVRGTTAELISLQAGRFSDNETAVAGIEGVEATGTSRPKYQVLRELGRGGMGIVYLARHVHLDKQVALKVLIPAMAQREEIAAQFVVEARAACRARHPAVIDVTDFGRLSDGRNFLVMEYVAWPTLDDEILRSKFSTERALHITRAIAAGLLAAHTHGVVHRDLKPANIFLGPEDQVKIADFGLAQTAQLDNRTEGLSDGWFGTLHYMSPEQTLGQVSDHRVDIYALGCILFELLSGYKPFEREHSEEIIEAHQKQAPPEIPGVSRRVQALCGHLMAKNPEDRPDSFSEVIEVIDEVTRELKDVG